MKLGEVTFSPSENDGSITIDGAFSALGSIVKTLPLAALA